MKRGRGRGRSKGFERVRARGGPVRRWKNSSGRRHVAVTAFSDYICYKVSPSTAIASCLVKLTLSDTAAYYLTYFIP